MSSNPSGGDKSPNRFAEPPKILGNTNPPPPGGTKPTPPMPNSGMGTTSNTSGYSGAGQSPAAGQTGAPVRNRFEQPAGGTGSALPTGGANYPMPPAQPQPHPPIPQAYPPIPQVPTGMQQSAPRLSANNPGMRLALAICISLVILCGIGFFANNLLAGRPLSQTAIAEKAKPATVLIYADFEATFEGPHVSVDSESLVADMRRRGEINASDTEDELRERILNELFKDPGPYLISSNTVRSQKAHTRSAGSGFILTPDGYIVTNAHVIEPSPQELKEQLLSTLADWVNEDIETITTNVTKQLPGRSLTTGGVTKLKEALIKFYAANMHMGSVEKTVKAVLGNVTPSQNGKPDEKPCEIKSVGKPTPGKDVAILKMTGSKLPTLPLAQNISVMELHTGEGLHVVGYPGPATFNPQFDPSSVTEPSMTNGSVSALRKVKGGWKDIQTDAAATHGNSGGPVLNDFGQVVGIMTFSTIDPESGAPVPGINFVVPVDIIREFLRDENIMVDAH